MKYRAQKLEEQKKEQIQKPRVQPSGISQLRKASEQTTNQDPGNDSMNLDEFIFSENMSTPAGMSISPEMEKKNLSEQKASPAMAIPIKAQKKEPVTQLVPQSVPTHQHASTRDRDEFGYIQRHVRKTSIDERQVRSTRCALCSLANLVYRTRSDLPIFHHRFPLHRYSHRQIIET